MGQTKGPFDDLVVLIKNIAGTVLLDFDADACQSPSRAYLLDVTLPGTLHIVWYNDLSLILLKIPKPTFVSRSKIRAGAIAYWGTFQHRHLEIVFKPCVCTVVIWY